MIEKFKAFVLKILGKIFPKEEYYTVSYEIMEAIYEAIPSSEINRVWEHPTDKEFYCIVKRAWEMVEENGYSTATLIWGKRIIYRYRAYLEDTAQR